MPAPGAYAVRVTRHAVVRARLRNTTQGWIAPSPRLRNTTQGWIAPSPHPRVTAYSRIAANARPRVPARIASM